MFDVDKKNIPGREELGYYSGARNMRTKGMSLVEAPIDKPLRIVDIAGGESVRRRLLAIGFHKGDVVELDSAAILKGPILIRSSVSGMRIALGRGIARKITVEVLDGRP
jgi:Fe2+ transport system protein FeoA